MKKRETNESLLHLMPSMAECIDNVHEMPMGIF